MQRDERSLGALECRQMPAPHTARLEDRVAVEERAGSSHSTDSSRFLRGLRWAGMRVTRAGCTTSSADREVRVYWLSGEGDSPPGQWTPL